MRISALVIGFSAGAYLMWRVAAPMPTTLPPCSADSSCKVQQAAAAPALTEPVRQDLRVVLYDPATDPSPRTERFARHEIDGLTLSDRLDAPAEPVGFHFASLKRSDARGVCAVFDGKTLQCVAIINPDAE